MYIQILLNYLLGYVMIEVEGYFIERFLNLCVQKQIFLWNSRREKSTILYTNISIYDFKRIREIAKQTKCRVKIEKKKGIPFFFHRYQKRKVFVFVAAFISILLIVSSRFIWNIEIEGNNNISKEELLQVIEENGLKIGQLKSKVNTKEIINQIRLDREDVAWIGIELQGTNACVKVVEADPKPDIIPEEEYCNVVADREAEIVKIKALNGTPLVKEGEIVKKGSVLIAGWLEGKYTGTRYVHATGEVEAKVWYTETQRVYFSQEQKEATGKEETKYTIQINNFTINLYKTLSKFEKYDTINENKKLKLFSNFYLPVSIIKTKNYEMMTNKITYGIEEAKRQGEEKAIEKLEMQIQEKEKIVNKYVNTYGNEEYMDVEVTYEVLENIGTKEKIVF